MRLELPACTLIHVEGVPFQLTFDTIVEGRPENVQLLAQYIAAKKADAPSEAPTE